MLWCWSIMTLFTRTDSWASLRGFRLPKNTLVLQGVTLPSHHAVVHDHFCCRHCPNQDVHIRPIAHSRSIPNYLSIVNVQLTCLEYRLSSRRFSLNIMPCLLLSKQSYQGIFEYFIGISLVWHYYWRHESIVLKWYNLNWVARQYGLTQVTPLYGLPLIIYITDTWSLGLLSLATLLRTTFKAWTFLFRLWADFRFYIALDALAYESIICGSCGSGMLFFLEMNFWVYGHILRKPRQTEHQSP